MCKFTYFDDTVQGELDELKGYASKVCLVLEMPLDGKRLCEIVRDDKRSAAREDPCFAETFIHMPRRTRLARLKLAISRAGLSICGMDPKEAANRIAALEGHSLLAPLRPDGVEVADARKRDRAFRILHRMKEELDPMGLFALAVFLTRNSQEEVGREWFHGGLGPLREVIGRVLREDLGGEGLPSRLVPSGLDADRVADAREQDKALRGLKRLQNELDPKGCFALAVFLTRKSPEEMGRKWHLEGLGPLREVIERVLPEEFGAEAFIVFKRLVPIWREAEQGADQSHAEG